MCWEHNKNRFFILHQGLELSTKNLHRWLKAPSLLPKVTWIKKGNNNTIATAIVVHFNLIGVPNNQQRLSKDNTLVPTAFVKLIPNF